MSAFNCEREGKKKQCIETSLPITNKSSVYPAAQGRKVIETTCRGTKLTFKKKQNAKQNSDFDTSNIGSYRASTLCVVIFSSHLFTH